MKNHLVAIILLFSSASFATSIYKIDVLKESAIVATGALGAILADANASKLVTPRCPCNLDEINSLDRAVIGNSNQYFDHLSDYTVASAVLLPVVASWFQTDNAREYAEDMTVLAESISVAQAFVTATKYSIQRPRPLTYSGDPVLTASPEGYTSFYSGHTTTAFAALTTAAVTYTLRNPEARWPWIVAGLVGSSVAFERVQSGKHFYSDVVVGAAVGTVVGFLVPRFHRRTEKADYSLAFVPVSEGGQFVFKYGF